MAERRRGLHSKDCAPAMLRRMRPFPPSVCIECGISIVTDADTTSQENFVDHVSQDHQREATSQYYSFPGVHLFEQWMRELQQRSRYKIRRFSMHNESLFFLCAADDRWCRTYGVNSDGLHCTAFVRVYDYRRVSRQETRVLRIQYCLDHNFHSDEDATVDAPFTPEIFMHEVEERRLRTAGMVKSHAQRARLLKRRGEIGSEIMSENGGVWSEEGVREDDSNLQELDAYTSDVGKRPSQVRNDDSTSVVEFAEGPDTEHDGQEDTVGGDGERNVDFGIEGSEEGVGQEEQVGENTSSKLKRNFPYGRIVKSDYDEKRESMAILLEGSLWDDDGAGCSVANLVEQCNRRVSESRSIRSIESREIQGVSGPGQPHYVTHRSNFSSYTLYNLVMQIELQCESYYKRLDTVHNMDCETSSIFETYCGSKKYLKYLTSLCDSIAADPDCNKPVEELAAEIFDLKEIVNSGIVVTKQTSLLPTLSFGSGDEGSNSAQQRDGKSESETQPLIFLPVVPARSTPEELGWVRDRHARNFSVCRCKNVRLSDRKKITVDEEAEMDVTEQSETANAQPNLRRSKRGKGKDETDIPFETKKGKSSFNCSFKSRSIHKLDMIIGRDGNHVGSYRNSKSFCLGEPYQTRRSRGVLKPNTKGVFDKATYVGGTEATSAEGDESKSPESRETYTLRRIPFSGQNSKLKLAGRIMHLGAESEELTGKPMTLRTAAGNLVTVMRRFDGRLIMVSPRIIVQKESKTPASEETQRETSTRKKTPKPEQIKEDEEEEEEEDGREMRSQRTTRSSERRSVYSKYLKKDKDRRAFYMFIQHLCRNEPLYTNPLLSVRKQLSENDVIVMDDETFSAVVKDMSMENPSECSK
ncbi:hypothetical protein DINM_003693 [Dirofilaria immitis]|nr:hypothetical protein [Dirofilaria immitis]